MGLIRKNKFLVKKLDHLTNEINQMRYDFEKQYNDVIEKLNVITKKIEDIEPIKQFDNEKVIETKETFDDWNPFKE